MSEMARIADLLEHAVEGKPYYGPSVMDALTLVTPVLAASRPNTKVHSVWELVAHLTAELRYARAVIDGTAGPWVGGQTTWPATPEASEAAWREALDSLRQANHALVSSVRALDDAILDRSPSRVQGPFYWMLHGTVLHTAYHAGQISLLSRQMSEP
jgi:uncharacterized damage-inducible protein DinB